MLAGCSKMPAISPLPATSQPATRTNSSSTFQILHIFDAEKNGRVPVGTLLVLNGTLYGTTNFGGDPSKRCYPGVGCGTVFELSSASNEKTLYRFNGNADGTRPYAGLVDVHGTLYGTTQSGGKNNEGAVFALTTSGTEHTVWAFTGKNGNDPRAGLTSDSSGAVYGTTYYGGAAGIGTVFAIGPSGTEKVLHSFQGGSDGSKPLGTLINVNNVLY
ncbi:MAG TPA: choice-of-anchor tandem repeat GloVer-containing protein, partial [Candidatus Cybelea sp.]